MKRFYNKAIFALRPNAQFVQRGSTYSGLEWLDTTSKKPTEQEIVNKIQEIKAAEPMRVLRIERNRRLAETDWIITKGLEQGTDIAKWKTYRQALRDLPATADPQLDHYGNLTNVDWPTTPENNK